MEFCFISSSFRMGRKPSARKIARRVLLFIVPAFITGYTVVSASDPYGGSGSPIRSIQPKSHPYPPSPPCYEILKHATEYSPDGGSKEYGNLDDLDCGEQGALIEFNFNYDDLAKMVNNGYTFSAPAGHSDKASAFADVKVRCAADTALTQFTYSGDTLEYTCCPKPHL